MSAFSSRSALVEHSDGNNGNEYATSADTRYLRQQSQLMVISGRVTLLTGRAAS